MGVKSVEERGDKVGRVREGSCDMENIFGYG